MDVRATSTALLSALSADGNGDLPPHRTRRRWTVATFLVAGACLLGVSLSVTPGDTAFYPLTIGLGLVWIVGGLAAGPPSMGQFALPGRSVTRTPTTATAIGLGIAAGVAVGACFVVGALVTRLIPPLADLVSQVLAFADYGSIAVVAAITLGNGVAEELFFRGAVYTAARPHHPVVISTVIYIAATLASGNVMLGFAAAILGSVCAVLRRVTGGVAAPVCTHVVWSTIVLFALPPIFG